MIVSDSASADSRIFYQYIIHIHHIHPYSNNILEYFFRNSESRGQEELSEDPRAADTAEDGTTTDKQERSTERSTGAS
jgi:hypothetical protein